MALVRWEAPEGLTALRRDLDRLFENFMSQTPFRTGEMGAWEPAVDPDKAVARLKDGVLEVTIPKSEKAKAKEIPVQA